MGADAAAREAGAPSTEVDAAPDHSDAASEGGNAAPVDPEVSRRWTWHPCGKLLPAGSDTTAVFGADGTLVVRGEDGMTRSYDEQGARRPETDGPVTFLTAAPDGTPVVGIATPTSVVIRPIGAATALFTFSRPASPQCGQMYAFSKAGDYFLAHGGGASCVWRVDDGGFVASFPDNAPHAAIRGRELVTLQARTDGLVDVVTRDFSGQETGRVMLGIQLGLGNALLSPAGDRVASGHPSTLWDVDGHALLVVMETAAEPRAVVPAFTATGDRLLLANGVFRADDGTRTATLAPLSRMYEARPLALSPDGGRAIASAYGRASLFDVSAPGFTSMLGPPLRWNIHDPVQALAISTDSVLVTAISGVAFGIRLAPRFEDSPTVWSIYAGDTTFVGEISANGKWASAAGDNRALFAASDGRSAWPSPGPTAVRCFGTQLRISSNGKWAAGASYAGTMDVFSLADATPTAWAPVATLPTECWGAAAFSRDERTLATSMPALYRVDPAGATWNPVWSKSSDSSLPDSAPATPGSPWSDVRFSPDETVLLVSRCNVEPPESCRVTLYDATTGDVVRTLADLTAPRPSFSPDGNWVVAGPTLLHLPSGDIRSIDPAFSTHAALFTPDGDIVAGSNDGALARYCRDR